jgi:hypothetical protein
VPEALRKSKKELNGGLVGLVLLADMSQAAESAVALSTHEPGTH